MERFSGQHDGQIKRINHRKHQGHYIWMWSSFKSWSNLLQFYF